MNQFQENVDSFTVSATKCARRMATFVKILNKEDISTMDNRDNIREVRWNHSHKSACHAVDGHFHNMLDNGLIKYLQELFWQVSRSNSSQSMKPCINY